MQSSRHPVTPLITLSLPRANSMLEQFPFDQNADITMILSSTRKNYRLQKKYLRPHSQFFKEWFSNERTCDSNIMLVSKKFDGRIFDHVLRCFYGGEYVVSNDQEFYTAYHICAYLKIDALLTRMEAVMIEEFHRLSFILVYQLGEMYQLVSVKSRCLDVLESDATAFRRIFDLNQIQCHYIKTKQLFGFTAQALELTDKAPTNILLLQEDTFKNLIKIHNEYKQVQFHADLLLPYEDIYKILKLYVEVRTQQVDECKDRLRALVLELIDKNWLSAKQYRCIYHQELLKHSNSGVSHESFDSLGRSTEQSIDIFDPLVSQNYLYMKELTECRSEYEQNLLELRKVHETLEQSVKLNTKLQQDLVRVQQQQEERDRGYRNKMEQYELKLISTKQQLSRNEKLLNQRDRLIEELQQKLSEAYLASHDQLNATVESELQVGPKSQISNKIGNLQESEIIEMSDRRSSVISARQSFQRLSLTGKLINYDYNPRCVINSKQLDCLIEFFQPSIFEKINLKLLYRRYKSFFTNLSSQDGQDPGTLTKHCRFQSDIIIFFRTEFDKVFGVYLNHEILTLEEQHKIYQGKILYRLEGISILRHAWKEVQVSESSHLSFRQAMYLVGEGCSYHG